MTLALHLPWTLEGFFDWAGLQESRYEFDGVQPVAMTGGTVNHGIITQNIHAALRARLRGSACRPLGPDVGLATADGGVRYPDAMVTCGKLSGDARAVTDAVVVFEVLSPSSGRTDRIVKVREYAAIASLRRYVIVESTGPGLTVLERQALGDPWRAGVLIGAGEVLQIPEIGIEIAVSELYEAVEFPVTSA